ncbi:MAG: SIS domain-containing protein [Frankiaceae bacterium]
MSAPVLEAALHAAFDRRRAAGEALGADAGEVAATCEAMADRFLRGGTLLVLGCGVSAADAAHVAVEFVHPVIVGKRALPALSLTADVATLSGLAVTEPHDMLAAPLRLMARPDDIALALSCDGREVVVRRALRAAHDAGLLTVALAGGDGGDLAGDPAVDHLLVARSDDPQVVKEVHVTTYHVLWEMVHVFLEQPSEQR